LKEKEERGKKQLGKKFQQFQLLSKKIVVTVLLCANWQNAARHTDPKMKLYKLREVPGTIQQNLQASTKVTFRGRTNELPIWVRMLSKDRHLKRSSFFAPVDNRPFL
jgi:hypothetical protein